MKYGKLVFLISTVVIISSCTTIRIPLNKDSVLLYDKKGFIEGINIKSANGYLISDIFLSLNITKTYIHYRFEYENNILTIYTIEDSSGSSVLKNIKQINTSDTISNQESCLLIDTYTIFSRDNQKIGVYSLYFVKDSNYIFISPNFDEQIQIVEIDRNSKVLRLKDLSTNSKYLLYYNFSSKAVFRIQE